MIDSILLWLFPATDFKMKLDRTWPALRLATNALLKDHMISEELLSLTRNGLFGKGHTSLEHPTQGDEVSHILPHLLTSPEN